MAFKSLAFRPIKKGTLKEKKRSSLWLHHIRTSATGVTGAAGATWSRLEQNTRNCSKVRNKYYTKTKSECAWEKQILPFAHILSQLHFTAASKLAVL